VFIHSKPVGATLFGETFLLNAICNVIRLRPTCGDERDAHSYGEGRFRQSSLNASTPTFEREGVENLHKSLQPLPTKSPAQRHTTEYVDTIANPQLTWPDGFYVNYTFDYLRRPIQVTGNGVGTLASYVWDGIGDLTAINRGNGADTAYAYDGDDRLSGVTNDFTNSADDVAWSFSYDAGSGPGRYAARPFSSPLAPLATIAIAT